jgi:hypothetical protein
MQFLKCAVAVLLAAPIFGSGGNPETGVTVHEWGTFTTIADGAGGSEPWSPLGGASDLPCFVMHLNKLQYKMMPQGSHRTRHPDGHGPHGDAGALFLLAAQDHRLGGRRLPQGSDHRMVSPRVQSQPRTPVEPAARAQRPHRVEFAPDRARREAALPQGGGASHYYAARNTDSDLVRIGQQQEKLLFYRGIANFSVPLSARVTGDSSLELRNTGDDPLALAVLFENRGGRSAIA